MWMHREGAPGSVHFISGSASLCGIGEVFTGFWQHPGAVTSPLKCGTCVRLLAEKSDVPPTPPKSPQPYADLLAERDTLLHRVVVAEARIEGAEKRAAEVVAECRNTLDRREEQQKREDEDRRKKELVATYLRSFVEKQQDAWANATGKEFEELATRLVEAGGSLPRHGKGAGLNWPVVMAGLAAPFAAYFAGRASAVGGAAEKKGEEWT
jgi:hypothetical protein